MKPITLIKEGELNSWLVDVIPVVDDPGGPHILLASLGSTVRLDKVQVARLHDFLFRWLKENG